MLHRIVKITALNANGGIVAQQELAEITFRKRGGMTIVPSKVLQEMLKEIDKGGAVFIEKVWAT